jgi:radical SAM protein with 4Fe4S-binding SPASM domain
MKINLFLNNRLSGKSDVENLKQIPFKYVKKILEDHKDGYQYILRGEPALYPFLYETLDLLEGKDYILCTNGYNAEALVNYSGHIPYLSIAYNGFLNDFIQEAHLTNNILILLDKFAWDENTKTRLQYIISRFNMPWLVPDSEIMVKLYDIYPNMKKPYFILDQQTTSLENTEFTWTPIGRDSVNMLSHKGLLSEANLNYLLAWLHKDRAKCTSIANEMVITWDGIFRTCMSLRFEDNLGNLEDSTLDQVIESSKEIRIACKDCPFQTYCWLAYHFKDNVRNDVENTTEYSVVTEEGVESVE